MKLYFKDVFADFERANLDRDGYAVGQLTIGSVPMHVVAMRVEVDDDGWVTYTGTMRGAHSDMDAIFALMGDGAGTPYLQEYNGHMYLLGCMPYAI